jgi:hypothetical protein
MDRSEIALRHINRDGRGLEIGPSYSPLVPKAGGARVEIVDHAERTELIAKYRAYGIDEERLARIETVDYVWQGGSLLTLIPERGVFDYVVASHLLEHTVDLIGFLQDCEALLNDNGHLVLVLPDKRYCFDRFQPLSTIGAVVDAHHSGRVFHSAGTLLDHQAYACCRGGNVIAWNEQSVEPLALQFANLEGATEVIAAGLKQESYHDVHCWRFVFRSFQLLIHDLRTLGYHHFGIAGSHDTVGHEFFVTLAKGIAQAEIDRLEALLQIEADLLHLHTSGSYTKKRRTWRR